jgi:hypothetical protein
MTGLTKLINRPAYRPTVSLLINPQFTMSAFA